MIQGIVIALHVYKFVSHFDYKSRCYYELVLFLSLKALQKERYILSSKMKKKLSMEQRQNLFLKWGIGLQSKHRRRQLVNLIWNDSKDLKHVAESASVVEKLVSFAKSKQAFMEIYSLDYKSGRPGNKFKLWISNVKSGDC